MYKPDFQQGEMRVRARHFQLPDKEGRKIAYTYIQKNGCSNFKVYLLKATGLDRVDSHFSPQKAHLAETDYNMPIPLENLTEEMGALLGTNDGPANAFLRPHNSTNYSSGNELGALIDVPVKRLESLILGGTLLNSSNFETAEVSERIHELYRRDFEMLDRLRPRQKDR